VNPVVLAMLLRECIRVVKNKAPSVIKEVIEARHPESDGGRMLTTKERQDIVRVALSRVAEEE
jgi:hypothetical protein